LLDAVLESVWLPPWYLSLVTSDSRRTDGSTLT